MPDESRNEEVVRSAEAGGSAEAGSAPAPTEPSAESAGGSSGGTGVAAPPSVPGEPTPPTGPQWYVLRVQAGKEDSTKRNIERKAKVEGLTDRIRRVLVPSELVSELRGKKKKVVERKLYPGYIMVEMTADEETVFHIRSVNGVGDFIGGGSQNQPAPLPPHEVERMLGIAESQTEEPKLDIKFKKGQSVKIRNGPFENMTGVVEDVSPTKGTIRVIVTIFGRATPIELEYWQVESV